MRFRFPQKSCWIVPEYENLAAAAKKFYVQERKESKLQKALDAAMKMISELKAKVTALTAELAEYKSVRSQLNNAELDRQNGLLRNNPPPSLRDVEKSVMRYLIPSKKIERSIARNKAGIRFSFLSLFFVYFIWEIFVVDKRRKMVILLIYQCWIGIIVLCLEHRTIMERRCQIAEQGGCRSTSQGHDNRTRSIDS